MKITILTVTYNSERFLEDCINSVINQQYENVEHIIIDAVSTDATISIIQRYESHIAKWVSEKDEGMYDALNKGMKMATGDIIGILNSDDMLASANVLSEVAAAFKEHSVDSIYGDIVYVDQMNTEKIIRYWKGVTYNRYRFTYGWMPAHPSFYFKRELFAQLGGYESQFDTAADYEFMSRYLYYHKITAYYIPKLLVKMRIGGASNKTLKRRFNANRRDYQAMKKNTIPLPFIVSILKPLIKLHQYYYTFFQRSHNKK